MISDSATILVVGAGAWGTALAARLAQNGRNIILYGRDQQVADQINSMQQHLICLMLYYQVVF